MAHVYYRIPSKASHAWFVWILLSFGFNALFLVTDKNPVAGIVALIFTIILIVQLVTNLINLLIKRPKFNLNKILVNIVLISVVLAVGNILKRIFG